VGERTARRTLLFVLVPALLVAMTLIVVPNDAAGAQGAGSTTTRSQSATTRSQSTTTKKSTTTTRPTTTTKPPAAKSTTTRKGATTTTSSTTSVVAAAAVAPSTSEVAAAAPATTVPPQQRELSSTKNKVDRVVIGLVAIAVVTALLTGLFGFHTSPRRRMRIARTLADQREQRLAAAAALANLGAPAPAAQGPPAHDPAAPAGDGADRPRFGPPGEAVPDAPRSPEE
jgi:hypothetical protein